MSMTRRALLSTLSASVICVAFDGVASAKGGGGGKGAGRDGALDTGTGIVPSPANATNQMQVRSFRIFEGKACRRDYMRFCPTKPIGKCDLESRVDQLSPDCKDFVAKHR
ncbi:MULTISPECIES: hypothetical protein [unclassified Mesorhizobium]|uniref:hypothetical protein n=1 Tax=unclassified Mesorhizobium TaxID=325217 RepID=UPI000F759D51|nr:MULTISPECIES: hypothetical protein [unclassified Mesorhizobium]TGT61015.1 hypothetical protein EN813_018805 [Mesorhizobium sp. M00.F.Ca.ET.170.01.1.1]AZO08785.1 hypothetical protein EJ074_06430 [Mesorhizobium sp. M3A.F.Ca.ET.080.04.2.1]RWB83704.1 MAG: hypothetical protein EOQ52_26255 [Mesorhizobium sp.]RWE23920.1 MAG: hypothetical protein EOS41_18490 [Mesorhizobium sp.]RWE29760.1 MAG: hypothetical protein EOS77_21910 [Mesorhizobium sp.]